MPGSTPKKILAKETFSLADAEGCSSETSFLWVQGFQTLYKNINTVIPRNGTTILNTMEGGNSKWVGIAGQYNKYSPNFKWYEALVNADGTPGVDCDYTDIQAAIDDGKKTIFIRKGTFTHGGDFTLSGLTDILLIGEDRDTVIIQGDDECDHAITMASCSRIKFENLTFAMTGITGNRNSLVYSSGTSEYVTFKNCRFVGDSPNGTDGYIERGIYSTSGSKKYWLITECIFEQLDYSGITLYDDDAESCDIVTITYNKFINSNGNFGIDTYIGCHYFLIAFNHFENLKSPVGGISGALFFNGEGGNGVNWNHSVICNVFKDCPLGIQFDHNCHDILVQGNQFYNGSVHIRFCGNDNTGHHVSNNHNANGSTANMQFDWATLMASAIFYVGGNFGNHPWRTVGQPNQPAYSGSWSPWVADPGAQFMANDDHEVVLRGVVQGGTGVIFTLPAQYSPSYDIQFPVVTSGSVIGIVVVRPTGNVDLLSGGTLMVDLGTIRFRLGSI